MVPARHQLTMGMPAGWGTLNPVKQSTFMASEILCNVYEPLVEYGLSGHLQPRLARSWDVSSDLRTYTFALDTRRRFSNGQPVTAPILKRSLEISLQSEPDSAKHSALDLLYRLDGFDQFSKTGKLSGITTPDDATIVFSFRSPMRAALDYLTGVRYAAFIVNEHGEYLGTGPYRFMDATHDKVILAANPYAVSSPTYDRIDIIGITSDDHLVAVLCSGEIDAYWTVVPDQLPACVESGEHRFTVASGAVVAHWVLAVNGNAGELLEDVRLRRALQYLIHRSDPQAIQEHLDQRRIQIDPQYLIPIVPGRLADNAAEVLIGEGKAWVRHLVAATQKRPLRFTPRSQKDLIISDVLKRVGVRLFSEPEFLDTVTAAHLYYKTHNYDLLSMALGFSGLDPDNLYHSLGEHGAITSPAIGRASVWKALEDGRALTNMASINAAYQTLSRAILRDVPTIHLAHTRIGLVFRQDRVVLNGESINAYRFDLNQLQPRPQGEQEGFYGE